MNKSIGLPPISPADLMALYKHLTDDVPVRRGLKLTRAFLKERGLPVERILRWLKCNSAFHDFEVVMNVCYRSAVEWLWASKARPDLASVCSKSWDIEPLEYIRAGRAIKNSEVNDVFDEMTPNEREFICQYWGKSGIGFYAPCLLALVERRVILKERGDLQEYEVRKAGTQIWLDSLFTEEEEDPEAEEDIDAKE